MAVFGDANSAVFAALCVTFRAALPYIKKDRDPNLQR